MLKTELESTHKKTVDKLANLTDESIEEIKGEDQEQEIIEKGGIAFRKVNLIKIGQLKNGQFVQISVSDIKNKTMFRPTDKIILYNY